MKTENKLKYKCEFTAFYVLILSTLMLTILLYALIATEFVVLSARKSSAVFYFMPTILMVLCYSLLYY